MGFILLLIIFGVFKDVCHGCEAGYYFDNKQCQLCPNNCSICSSVSSCTVCKVGKYGTDCSSSCPKNCHDNVCNINSGICLSCKQGYYSDNNNSCVPCPYNCTTCSSGKYCFACKNGFRGVICNETCFNCQHDTGCDKNSGYCFVNCREGLSGELCNFKCDSKCKSCERLNEHECISCTDDENGKPCKMQLCLLINRCLKSTGNKSDGSGDLEGYTGNQTCVSYCKDTVYNITSKERPSSSTTTTNIGVILGPVIGSIIIIGFCIILVRRFSTKRRCSVKMSDDKNPDKSMTPKTNGNSAEAAALLPHQGECSKTACSQTSETASSVKVNMPDENKRSQEEDNLNKPGVKSREQAEFCDDRFQQSKGANLSNIQTSKDSGLKDCASRKSIYEHKYILIEESNDVKEFMTYCGNSRALIGEGSSQFWTKIWEYDIRLIVMLTDLTDEDEVWKPFEKYFLCGSHFDCINVKLHGGKIGKDNYNSGIFKISKNNPHAMDNNAKKGNDNSPRTEPEGSAKGYQKSSCVKKSTTDQEDNYRRCDASREKLNQDVSDLPTGTCEGREIYLYRFIDWPDTQIPGKLESFVRFHAHVKERNIRKMVCCSTGWHRCSSYIAFDLLKQRDKTVDRGDICNCLTNLKDKGIQTTDEQANHLLKMLTHNNRK